MISVRTVKLHGGPLDGIATIASGHTAWMQREVYVWDGGSDEDALHHAPAVVGSMDAAERAEMDRVQAWIDRLAAGDKTALVPAPAEWIVNLCVALRNYS